MGAKPSWSILAAFLGARRTALAHPDDFLKRFGWDSHDLAEVDAIYAEVITKIPADATKVLEIGCGDGRFAAALTAARPAIGYQGLDLVPENVATAKENNPTLDFAVGNFWEYLPETATPDWDFIVSIGCLFYCTDPREMGVRLNLLDSKATKGFSLLVSPKQVKAIQVLMPDTLTRSTGVSASYYEGTRDFLDEALLKGTMAPIFVHRSGTTTPVPTEIPAQYVVMGNGLYNRALGRQTAKIAARQGEAIPVTFTGKTIDRGLVTGDEAMDLDPTWTEGIKVVPLPPASVPEEPTP
jgi:hypothetical protein